MGQSAAGRVVVERVLGKAGALLIKALKGSLTRFNRGDNAAGKDLRMRVLRLAWNCSEHAVALQRLDAAGTHKLSGPLSLLISNLVDQLRSPIMTRSPVRLALLLTEVYNVLVNLLESVFPADSLQDLAVVYATLSDLPFAVFFLTAHEAGPERDVFAASLEDILQAHIDVAHAAAQALRRKLLRQQRTLVQLLHNPQIEEQTRLIVYLRHPVTATHATSWLVETFGEIASRWLAFYASVDSYKQHTGNSTMSAIRASAIVDMYVRPEGERHLGLPDDIVREIEDGIAAHVFNRRLFARAQAHIYLLANAKFAAPPPQPETFAASVGADMEQAGFVGSRQMKQLTRDLEEVTRRLGFFAAVDNEGVKAGRLSMIGPPPDLATTAPGVEYVGGAAESEELDDRRKDDDDDDDEDEDDEGDVLGDMHGDNLFGSKLGPARVTFWAT